jgi:muramoyltetrapeptide carboxypeptidase LdcA involved in peptidoglycan recycling
MIIPGFIGHGDTIGVTAPSSGASEPLDKVRFMHARDRLAERGYGTRFTSNVFTDIGDERSSPAEQRARELESLISDKDVRYMVSASGGEHLNEIFEFLDMSGLRDDPKWIQGYSDNTDILLMATVNHDVMSIYCGNYGDYGMEPWHRSVTENLEFVEGKRKCQTSFDKHAEGFVERITGLEPFECVADTVWDSPDVGFRGRLVGGCFDKLKEMVGTDRDRMRDFAERYRDDGIVWYMEVYVSDHDDTVSALASMRDSGWFENVHGFVFGRPLFYDGNDYKDAVTSAIGDLGVPIVFDADVGHKAPRMTFVNGAIAEFDIRDGKCTLNYPELGLN